VKKTAINKLGEMLSTDEIFTALITTYTTYSTHLLENLT